MITGREDRVSDISTIQDLKDVAWYFISPLHSIQYESFRNQRHTEERSLLKEINIASATWYTDIDLESTFFHIPIKKRRRG